MYLCIYKRKDIMRFKKKESILTIRIDEILKNKFKLDCENSNITMTEYIISYLEKKYSNE